MKRGDKKKDSIERKEVQLFKFEMDEMRDLAEADSRTFKNYMEKVLRDHLQIMKIKNSEKVRV